jgi:hypothetical protein
MNIIVPFNFEISENSTSFRKMKIQRNPLGCFSNFENGTLTKCRHWVGKKTRR